MRKANEDSFSRDSEIGPQPVDPAPPAVDEIAQGKRIAVAGVGNGGCNVVAHLARHHREFPGLVAINTDPPPSSIPAGLKYVTIGSGIMKGMGTGGDPRVGRRAAESDIGLVKGLFHDAELCFLVVGLGGGTGTGAAPAMIEAAGDAGALTLCFAMLPFAFEGSRRMQDAKRGLLILQNVADGVICMPNQRLFKPSERRTSLSSAFKRADETICRGIYSVWRDLCRPANDKGIRLGFEDLRTLVIDGSGRCVFACAEGSGSNKVAVVLKEIRNDPLLREGKALEDAHAFLVSITGGPDLSLMDVNEIVAGIPGSGRKQALMKTGVSCDPTFKDKVSVTLLVSEKEHANDSGFDPFAGEGDDDGGEAGGGDDYSAAGGPSAPVKSAKRTLRQAGLFDSPVEGRFKGVDPTIIDGSNFDIPTYIRRGIRIQKPRFNAFEP